MKHLRIALWAAALTAVLPTSQAQTQTPPQTPTLQKIAASQKITVSYREAAVPFSYVIGTHKAVGFAVDLTEAIVDDVRRQLHLPGLQVVYLPVTAQNRIPLLIDGTYDLECGSTTNNSVRGQEVAFAINHFYTGTRLLAKKTAGIRGYADLAGKTVASTAGSTNEKVIRQYGADHGLNLQIVLGKDYGDALRLVTTDQAVAFAMDDVLLFGLRAQTPDPSALEVVGDTLQVEPYACMLRKNDPAFKKLVDGTLTRLMRNGDFTQLYRKWFESPIPPQGVVLNMPMGAQLKANLKARSDQPAR